MQANAYRSMAREENRNWYYRARWRAIDTLIQRYVRTNQAELRILDVGCGTGGTSHLLGRHGPVTGIEPSGLAIELLRSAYSELSVVQGGVADLPSLVPLRSFDLATVLGVLYHRSVADPQQALRNVAAVLRDDGWLIWAECVYPCLARQHDEFVNCQHRFYPREMHRLLQSSGFEVVYSSHLAGWAFPIAWAMALAFRAGGRFGRGSVNVGELESTDDRPLPPLLNALLEEITYREWRASLLGWKMPLGVSRLVLARKVTVERCCDSSAPQAWQTTGPHHHPICAGKL
jgi:SAM-dependent methyltransferase